MLFQMLIKFLYFWSFELERNQLQFSLCGVESGRGSTSSSFGSRLNQHCSRCLNLQVTMATTYTETEKRDVMDSLVIDRENNPRWGVQHLRTWVKEEKKKRKAPLYDTKTYKVFFCVCVCEENETTHTKKKKSRDMNPIADPTPL